MTKSNNRAKLERLKRELVRDATSIIPMTKSEMRARIKEISGLLFEDYKRDVSILQHELYRAKTRTEQMERSVRRMSLVGVAVCTLFILFIIKT